MAGKHLWKVTVVQPSSALEKTYRITETTKQPDWNKLTARVLKIALKNKDSWNNQGTLVLRVTEIIYGGAIDG